MASDQVSRLLALSGHRGLTFLMSAFGGKADIPIQGCHARFCPKADIGRLLMLQ